MNFLEICVRRPILATVLSLTIIVFGIVGFLGLPVRELPDVDPPVVNVLTTYPGASAEVVETEITERLEEAISSVDGIKLLSSSSKEQVSSITVEFVQERNVDVAAQDVRDRVSRVRSLLPDEVDEPVVSKQDSSARPIIWVAFFSDSIGTRELSTIADIQVKQLLQTVPGVASIILGGEKRLAMRVWLDSAQLTSRGLTILDVERALRRENLRLPAGRVEGLDRELQVQFEGKLGTPEEFGAIILKSLPGGGEVRLRDVARVAEGDQDDRVIGRFKGRPSIGLGIVRQSKANTLDVARLVKARMAEIGPSLPPAIQWDFPYDESVHIEKSIKEVFETIGLASILVVITVFLFLGNLRATLIPALAIPVSVIGTFGVLWAMGYSINSFTLLALVLAVGLVVDDAIIVLENISRLIGEGLTPIEAAKRSARELGFAIIVITLSLATVFLPLAFIGGLTGKLLTEFAVSLAASVVISGFVALTLTPAASARILDRSNSPKWLGFILAPVGAIFGWNHPELDSERLLWAGGGILAGLGLTGLVLLAFKWSDSRSVTHVEGPVFGWIHRRYTSMLDRFLRNRWVLGLIVLGSFGLSGYFFNNLSSEFLPEEDKGSFVAVVLTPEGSSPDYSNRMMAQMESYIEKVPEVQSFFAAVALPFNGPGDSSFSILFARLKEGKRRHLRDILYNPDGLFFHAFLDVEGAFAIPIMPKAVDTGFTDQPFKLVISHPDLPRLAEVSQKIAGLLAKTDKLSSPRAKFELSKPEVRLRLDRDRAAALNVSIEDAARTLQILVGGIDIGNIQRNGKQYDVIARLDRSSRLEPNDISNINIRTLSGGLIPLSNLVTMESGSGPNQIDHHKRRRSATIEASPKTGVALGDAMKAAREVIDKEMPKDFEWAWEGDAKYLNESSTTIYMFMGLSIVCVFLVLAAQFESWTSPLLVMLAVPLSFVGAFGILYLMSWLNYMGWQMWGFSTFVPNAPDWAKIAADLLPRTSGMNINIFSQVGLVLQVGLDTKNSILLVDFANRRVAQGVSALEAVREAGRTRLRPILMTSLCMIVGILPIALGWGEAAESRRPLGLVVVGGIISSTLLTIFVVPVAYVVLANLRTRFGKPAPVEAPAGKDPSEISADF